MGDCESPFEEAVAAALEAEGFVVTPQVGVAGFFIDLAVSDPETPGRYILGIECDGASYHSSRSARDRDRLRQECLENQGWVLHRIWSTDWFQRPEDELRRAVAAIEAARIEMVRRVQAPTHASSGRDGLAASSVERGQSLPVPEKESIGIAVVPYEEANFGVPNSKPIHEIALHRLAEIVHKIIAVEQPVHIDEVARRVTTLWGQSRTGARIVKAVKRAVRATASASGIRIHDDFCSFSGSKIEHIRTREAVISATLRKPEMLPLDEVSVAVKSVVATTFGAPRDELYTVVARLFGFKSTSAQLRERIDRAIDRLVESHVLYEREGVLSQANTASDVSVPLPFPMRQDGASAG